MQKSVTPAAACAARPSTACSVGAFPDQTAFLTASPVYTGCIVTSAAQSLPYPDDATLGGCEVRLAFHQTYLRHHESLITSLMHVH